MGIFNSFDINASGMTAQRYRMDVISENIANINTTRTADGSTYRRKVVVFEQRPNSTSFRRYFETSRAMHDGQGVRVARVLEDHKTQMVMAFDPAHPDADENGYVTYPNVNVVTEMTNIIDASRAYEANATAFNASKSMALKGLEMAQ
ncbi:MAG: flagellar basal body rod protein FlgC [Lachnospiraceae bacterium]|jgi:flagellar basal-body rod protein FlgC|nr:flagellar basal body rod protein FlgC [Lachnospiraceae bacterium]